MKKIYPVLFIIMTLVWACNEKETDYTENDLIIAAYLSRWGMDNVDMNSLRHLDILYYFFQLLLTRMYH